MDIPVDRIRIQTEDFSIEKEIEKIKSVSKKIGGIAVFLGTAREISKGRDILKIDFEHYPQMAEKGLAKIRETALKQFDIIDVTLIHRVGTIEMGQNIVLIVVGAMHRQEAFSACSWCIDTLKKTVPIWKKETTSKGEIWVEEHP